MKIIYSIILSAVLLFATSCGANDEAEQDLATAAEETAFQASDTFKQQLEGTLDAYFLLTSSLVEADEARAAEHSEILIQQMQEIEADELDEQARAYYAEAYGIITGRAANIAGEADIEAQRYEFEYLSEAMIETVERFGPLSYDVYVQRCPMVRDGSADWLSRESQILNPYHGDRMLRCGSVVREL